MVAGALCDEIPKGIHLVQNATIIAYKSKENMEVLGDFLDQGGATSGSVEFNCARADGHYFKHKRLLSNPALPVAQRLQAWFQTTATRALYNAGTWHLTASLLSDLRTWELKKLRRLLRLQRKPDEYASQYNMRTSRIIAQWCSKYGFTFLYARVIKMVFKAAFKDKCFEFDYSAAPLRHARMYRNSLWWETWGALVSPAKRRKLGIIHRQAGQQKPSWEYPFVCV